MTNTKPLGILLSALLFATLGMGSAMAQSKQADPQNGGQGETLAQGN